MKNVPITNMRQFHRATAGLSKKVRNRLEQAAIEPGAKYLETSIKQMILQKGLIRTGALLKSIKARRTRGGWIVGVSKKQMRKGKWLEYGTVNMEAKPFFWGPAHRAMSVAGPAIRHQAAVLIRAMGR